MTTPIFQAPPPPPLGHDENVQTEQQPSDILNDTKEPVESNTTEQKLSQKDVALQKLGELKEKFIRYFWYSVCILFFLGMFMGCAMSGKKSTQTAPVQKSALRVVKNKHVLEKYKICGKTLPSENCFFYILNNFEHPKQAKDFFDDVSLKTGRQKSRIEIDNALYAHEMIPRGEFAEILVPSTKQ